MFELDVSLDDAKLRHIVTMLGHMPERTHRAVRRGVSKAAKRLASEIGRDNAYALAIVRAAMRGRLRTYRKGDGVSEKVWLGMNALAAHRIGRPIQTRTGVQVGQHFFDRAFVVRKWGGVYYRVGKERFPLTLAKLDIEAESARVMRAAYLRADDYLLQYVKHELEWEMEKLYHGGLDL